MKKNEIKNLLKHQKLISDNDELADLISDFVEVQEFKEEKKFVKQGDLSNDIYFILKGEVEVRINDRRKAVRFFGEQVGEMAIVNCGAPRSACLIARKNTVLAKLDEEKFSSIADKFPILWRRIAQSLAKRLLERNMYEREKNSLPRIFVASSSESLEELNIIKDYLNNCGADFEVEPWTSDNIFEPSSIILDELQTKAKKSDFAIIILGRDDQLNFRNENFVTVRDNVIFELGLFMGAIGERERIFIIEPKQEDQNLKLKKPTDLSGVITLQFSLKDKKNSLEKECEKIKNIVIREGTV